MERLDHIFTLNELLENTQERQAERPEEPLYQDLADALQAGIQALEAQTKFPHKLLPAICCLLAALGMLSILCGMGYVLLGNLSAAHQMAPYTGILAILSVLSYWAVKA